MAKIKYCSCGCVLSGNYHVNTDSSYHDKSIKGHSRMSELGSVFVKICKPHGCRNPKEI